MGREVYGCLGRQVVRSKIRKEENINRRRKTNKSSKQMLPSKLSLHRPPSFAERTFSHSNARSMVSPVVHVRWGPGRRACHLPPDSAPH